MNVWITMLALFITSCQSPQKLDEPNFLGIDEFAIISIDRDQITCLSAKQSPCGLTLEYCLNGLSYLCAQNVGIFSLKKFKESPKASYGN